MAKFAKYTVAFLFIILLLYQLNYQHTIKRSVLDNTTIAVYDHNNRLVETSLTSMNLKHMLRQTLATPPLFSQRRFDRSDYYIIQLNSEHAGLVIVDGETVFINNQTFRIWNSSELLNAIRKK